MLLFNAEKETRTWTNELRDWLSELGERARSSDLAEIAVKAEQLSRELERRTLRIVVVGEFNNGKSTLVNALIGEPLLPTDVVPTTALLHWVVSDDNRSAEVLFENGRTQTIDLSAEELRRWSADEVAPDSGKIDDIAGIELRLPFGLEHGTVIIDTPGLNDLNETRPKITYEYIPQADAVIVVLNALHALRDTERKFLEESLLQYGLDRIVFALNFADLAEDEAEDAARAATRKLRSVQAFANADPLLVSALEGVEARASNNAELWESSGMAGLERAVTRLAESGSAADLRWNSSLRQAERLSIELTEDLALRREAAASDKENLLEKLAAARRWKEGWSQRQDILSRYVEDRQAEMEQLVRKSIRFLFATLTEELLEKSDYYQGGDLSNFVSSQLSITIRKRLKGWIEQYGYRIDALLAKLAEQLSEGLSQSFEDDIRIGRVQIDLSDVQTDSNIAVKKGGVDSAVKSGFIVGGVGVLAGILGGPLLMPLVTMAGMPLVNKLVRERDLQARKPEIKALIQEHLDEIERRFSGETMDYVNECARRLHRKAVEQFDKRLERYETEIGDRLRELEREADSGDKRIRQADEAKTEADKLHEKLRLLAAERSNAHA